MYNIYLKNKELSSLISYPMIPSNLFPQYWLYLLHWKYFHIEGHNMENISKDFGTIQIISSVVYFANVLLWW